MTEPRVIHCTPRPAINEFGDPEFHLECLFEDGQKYSPIIVDGDHPELVNRVAYLLNTVLYEKSQ